MRGPDLRLPGRGAARRRARSGGFTLIELLLTIAVSMGFAAGLYAFFFTGLEAGQTHQSQARAQGGLRTSMEILTRDLRQAVTADDGINGGVMTLTSTQLVVHTDPNRSPGATNPVPLRVTYRLQGNELQRLVQRPINAGPVWEYGPASPPDVLLKPMQNGARPLFQGYTEQNVNLGSPVAQPRDIKTVRIILVAGQKTGNSPTTTELTTDVTLRNTLRY